MQKKPILIILLAILALSGLFLYGYFSDVKVKENQGSAKINIMVSILPQIDFVERIGGDKVEVTEMIPPGFNPAVYEPSPEKLQQLQEANIYFRIGHIAFENAQMKKLSKLNSSMKIIDTSEGITLLPLAEGDEDEEGGDDPHIWLSPKLVKIQAEHIYNALVEYSPENQQYFEENYNQFLADLDQLDQDLQQAFLPIQGQTILVYHPAFGYLADAYGFYQKAIEIEGKDPTPAQLQEIIDTAKEQNIRVIFVQSQFSTKSAESVAEQIDGAVVQIDPLAEDYFANLESMAQTIVSAVQ